MVSERYKIADGSQSAHCCFTHTVVDTTQPVMIGGDHYDNQFEVICECFTLEDAQLVTNALNQRETK